MDLGTIYGAIDLNDGPFRAGLTRSLTQLNGWKGSALKIAGAVGATFGTLAVGAMVKNSISAFADFESNLNQVEAATKAPGAAMERLSDLALQMGKDTVFSAGEASGAMLELAKSGMTPAQIEAGALAAALKLAAAGGMGLEAAATTTANAINMFGLEAKDANAVANALAGGANASSASVESLAQGLSQVGPGARNAGMSLQETVAVLAAFDNAGIKGSDAGTSLKTMLTSLTPTTSAAADAMKQVGLMTENGTNAFINADGSFKSMTQIAGLLRDNLSDLSEAQRSQALEAIFGSDASRAATALMNLGSEGIRKNIKATQDKTAADQMAEARMKGLKGAFETLGGSIETLGISLLIHFGPALTSAVEGLAGVFNLLIAAIDGVGPALEPATQFLSEHETAAKVIAGTIMTLLVPALIAWAVQAGTAAAASTAAWVTTQRQAIVSGFVHFGVMTLIGLGWIMMGVRAVAGAAVQVGAWLLSRLSALGTVAVYALVFALIAAGWIMAGVQAMLGAARMAAAWLIAMGPIGWVILAITAIVALIVLKWDWIKQKTAEAWSWIVGILKEHWDLILAVVLGPLGILIGFIIKHWDQIKQVFSNGVDAVVGFVQSLPDRIMEFFSDAGSWLSSVGEDIMNGLVAGIEHGFDWVRDKLRGVGRAIPGWLKQVLGITSPSKVMRDDVGRWIPAGVAEGIEGGTPDVADAARRMGLAAVIPITAAPSLRVPPLGTAAAAGFGTAGAAGTDGRQGPLIHQDIHPQPGMSEREVGVQAGNQALAALAKAGA